jgi:DNA polymerase-3 subunit chi
MKIDFYVLETTTNQLQALYFACQLIQKFHEEHPIYVHMNTHADAERLDALLWTFKDDVFIPHQLYDPTQPHSSAVQIGFNTQIPTPHSQGILLNLCPDPPIFYTTFNHLIEIVFNDPLVQQLARERYKVYRQQNHELNTIKLKTHTYD